MKEERGTCSDAAVYSLGLYVHAPSLKFSLTDRVDAGEGDLCEGEFWWVPADRVGKRGRGAGPSAMHAWRPLCTATVWSLRCGLVIWAGGAEAGAWVGRRQWKERCSCVGQEGLERSVVVG